MTNIDIINAMANYIKENDCNHEKIMKAGGAWLTADEWASNLGMEISTSRMTAMYKAGLVLREKDKKHYGDNVFHYWPANLEVTAW